MKSEELNKEKKRIIYLPKSKADPGDFERCPICGHPFKRGETGTIRGLWSDQGGFGFIPPIAFVHVDCDRREQARQASKHKRTRGGNETRRIKQKKNF